MRACACMRVLVRVRGVCMSGRLKDRGRESEAAETQRRSAAPRTLSASPTTSSDAMLCASAADRL